MQPALQASRRDPNPRKNHVGKTCTAHSTVSARLVLTRRQDLALALAREMWNYQNLNLGFDIVDGVAGVAGFHILRNRFPGQSFYKDLHPTTKA